MVTPFHISGKFGSLNTPCLFQLAVDVLCTYSSSRRSQAVGLQRSASWSAAPWCPPPPCRVQKHKGKGNIYTAFMFLHLMLPKSLDLLVMNRLVSCTCWPFEAVSQAWCRYHSDRHQSWESAPGSDWQGAGWVSPPCRGRDAAEAGTERSVREGLQRERKESQC